MIAFELTPEQAKKIAKFHPKCRKEYKGAIGISGDYVFTPTSLGVIVKYVCTCGKELDVTDYDW